MRQRWPDVVSDVVLAVWIAVVAAQHVASVAGALSVAGVSADLRAAYVVLGLLVLVSALARRCFGHAAHGGSVEGFGEAARTGRAASAQEVAGDR